MVVIAVAGLIVGILGTVVGQQLVGDLNEGVVQSLELTAEVLDTVDESFVVAGDALVIVTDGVGDAAGAVRSLGGSMAEGQEALDSVTELTGGEVADALESVEQALPGIQTAADAIDDTLSALSSLPFGPPYNPNQTFGETIGEVREGLAGLPEQLREQAEQVGRTGDELAAAAEGTVATADALTALEGRLTAANELIGQYADRTIDAQALVETQRVTLSTSATRARLVVIAFGIVFVLSQFVPLYLGRALMTGGVIVSGPAPRDGGPLAPLTD